MTMKPFEIQGTTLSIGGVDLSTSSNGKMVIPGITRATGYVVDSVEDRGDQTVQWEEVPTVVDGMTWQHMQAGTWNQSTSVFTYNVELDDDGYIDDIEASGGPMADTWVAAMEQVKFRATTVANPFASINLSDWVEIPFVAEMTANEVESDFGGGGGASTLEDLDNVQIDTPAAGEVLTWNSQREQWENQTVSGGGGGSGSGVVNRDIQFPYGESGDTKGTLAMTPWGGLYICTTDWTNQIQNFEVSTGENYMSGQDTNNRPAFIIPQSEYQDIASLINLANPSDWIIDGELDGGDYTGPWDVVEIVTWTFTDGDYSGQQAWAFYIGSISGGNLSVPEGTTVTLKFLANQNRIWEQASIGALNILGTEIITTKYAGGESSLELDSNDVQLQVDNDDNSIAKIRLNNTDTSETYVGVIVSAATENAGPDYGNIWKFKHDGSLEFPDGTLQTTAYTGQSGGGGGGVTVTADLWVAGGESPGGASIVTSTDGVTWSPQLVTIPSSWIKRVAISDTMIVYLAGTPGGDAIYYADAPETTPTMATGTDGVAGATLEWREINYLGGKFVAVGCAKTTATVTSNITSVTLPAGERTTLITIANTTFDFDNVAITISGASNSELNGNFRLYYSSLDEIQTGVYELKNTDGSPITLTSNDVTGASLQTTGPEEVATPALAYSTDGITWSYSNLDPDYVTEVLGTWPFAFFGDVAYNGTGYLLPVVQDRFTGYGSDPTAAGPGAFYVTDLATTFGQAQFISGGGEGSLPGAYNNIASYADGTFFVCDDNFALWTSNNPTSSWTLTQLAPAMSNLFGYAIGTEPGQIDGDVDSAVGGTVNGNAMWAATTNEGHVIWTTDNGTTIQGSVPDPFVVVATLVTSTSTETLLDFAGEQRKPYQWEKVTVTVTGNDDVNWEGTYYVYAPDYQNNSQFYLYDAVEGNGIPSDGFTTPSNPFTVELSRGGDLGAIHIADDVCIVYNNDSNKLHRSTDMINWTTVFTNTDYSIDDIYYGTRSSTSINRLDYSDEESGYNSSAVLTYDFKVDVDNSHVDINGDGTWEIGSDNFHVKIGSDDFVAPEELDITIRTPNGMWTFDRDGKLHFPDNTKQTTAYIPRNVNLDGGGSSVHYDTDVAFVDGGFSATRHGVADPSFDGGNRLTVINQTNLDGGGA